MSRVPPSSLADIVALIRRRKWWIVVPLLAIPPLVFFVGSRIPRKYRSETVILVDPQKIPTEYVKATAGDVADRLQNIREEVMSRTRLQRIADDLGLYQEIRNKSSQDAIITAMRHDISVDLIRGANDKNPVGGFKISYTSLSPTMAQKVTQQIANLFIEENLHARGQQAQGTNEFIQSELEKSREALKEQEAKISAFKAAHFGSLPEQEASNLQLIGQLQSLAEANSQAIDRATQQRVYLQSMLNINGNGDKSEIARPLSPAQVELQAKQAQLNAAEQRYTPSHPDVMRLQNEVRMLEQKVRDEPKGKIVSVGSTGPNVAQQFESQLASIQQEIRMRTERQTQLEGQIHNLQARIAVVPAVQGQFADLNRDYEGLQKNYQSLIEKEQSSGMAAELELHEQSERFRVLDPASLPSSPSSPNLLLINAAGICGALLIGFALAFLIDMMDPTIHTPEECDRYLNVPLIVTIPAITVGRDGPAQRRFKGAG